MADPFTNYREGLSAVNWGEAEAAWNARKGAMVEGFSAAGFGPTVTAKYRSKIGRATYRAPDVGKAIAAYERKMRS